MYPMLGQKNIFPKKCSEIIPLTENIEDYFQKNVLPFNQHAFYYHDKEGNVVYSDGTVYDDKHNKIGYEIPFVKLFYRFIEPRMSEDIFSDFEKLSKQENALTKMILGKALTEEEENLIKGLFGE